MAAERPLLVTTTGDVRQFGELDSYVGINSGVALININTLVNVCTIITYSDPRITAYGPIVCQMLPSDYLDADQLEDITVYGRMAPGGIDFTLCSKTPLFGSYNVAYIGLNV